MKTKTATAKRPGAAEIRLSFSQAGNLMGKDRRTIAEIAKSKKLVRTDGKPLDAAGFREIADYLGVHKEIPVVLL